MKARAAWPSCGQTLILLALLALPALLAACGRRPPDATPEGALRMWIDRMEAAVDDQRGRKDAYELLSARARANLKARAERASRAQGRRFEPYEMLAEGRFALTFRPKSMSTVLDGDQAAVHVRGELPSEEAMIKTIRERDSWRVDLDLPDPPVPQRRRETEP